MPDYWITRCEVCGYSFKIDFDKGLKFKCPNCSNIIEYIIPTEKNDIIELGDNDEDKKENTIQSTTNN